ncbi:Uncharacterised protein [BD1-7 clade bacterium]|uniref:Urease accessory protein UreH-like transmembrane domain-containing protein n=1 Tax=BD1-7 clade bacterium TaxID=2029982 RepID=A0A5S9QXL1_9GAMM|nr:Uncharacterised protein [BD1-7 clade bacterium]
MTYSLLAAAFGIGLLSTSHCIFMCGGIASALSANVTGVGFQRFARLALFHLGRISCYALLGFFVASILSVAADQYKLVGITLRHVAAFMMIMIGFYIAGAGRFIKFIEKRFSFIWSSLQPLVQRYIGMKKIHHAYLLGFLWGFLPCGVIYSTLIWASSSADGLNASVLMFVFGLGTLPGFLALGVIQQPLMKLMRSKHAKWLVGLAFILFGFWTLASFYYPMLMGGGAHNHSSHMMH